MVMRLKLLIDTKAKRVVFAEAGKECVDFLFQILTLPVATIICRLQPLGMEGSWPNLYKSVQDLNNTYVEGGRSKVTFLKPMVPVSSCLAINDAPVTEKKLYRCGANSYSCSRYITDNLRAVCPGCHRLMMTTTSYTYVAPPNAGPAPDGGGLVKAAATYMVMDDLVVKPLSTISTIAMLNKFNVKDVGVLEEKEVNFGFDEALKLLKASHHSKNVLTDVFC